MAGSNGKAPQHHLSTAEIIAKARERKTVPFHWDALDIDVVIRPRTTGENADVIDEGNRHNAAIEEYRGTPDEPSSRDAMRIRLRASINCILWPDDLTPVFDHESVDQLLDLDTPSLNELLDKVETVSTLTKTEAEVAAKNSVTTGADSTSSTSPVVQETPTSSPIPTPSAG